MRRRLSLTARTTVLFAIVASVALAGLGGITLVALEKHFEELDREHLLGKVELVQQLATRVDSASALAALPNQLRDALVGHHDLAVVVVAPDETTLYASDGSAFLQSSLAGASSNVATPLTKWKVDGKQFRGMGVTIPTRLPGGDRLKLGIAVDIGTHVGFIGHFGRALALYILIAAVVCAAFGWVAVRRGLQPLYAMKERASGVMAGQLNVRMPVEAVPVEMAELAATLNRMLDRLEDAFRRLTDFSSDIAHELRTPICNLVTQTHVALSQARTNVQYRDVLASNAEELDRLTRMVADMLFLAKAEHGLMLPSRVVIDLAHEVNGLFEFFDALAEDRQVRFQLSGAGKMRGDRLLIRRALSNLLSNALRYTPRGQTISVSIQNSTDGIAISVHNPGPPISQDALPHIFDRFYRAEKDRAHRGDQGDGAGLGLAIVQAVVTALGGKTKVESGAKGTVFTLEFQPGWSDATASPTSAGTLAPPKTSISTMANSITVDVASGRHMTKG